MFLREASPRVSFRLNPWQGLPGVACSKHAPGGGCPVSPDMCIFCEALFDAPLRNDVELVCEIQISEETIRHEDMMGARPLSN